MLVESLFSFRLNSVSSEELLYGVKYSIQLPFSQQNFTLTNSFKQLKIEDGKQGLAWLWKDDWKQGC